MSRYIVAVSGGVDSVVLLDMLHRLTKHQLIVAHFDHGIRDDSHEDAAFVAELAANYGLPFETRREELGPSASEEKARLRRYAFLRELADKHQARIVTAHHYDDAIETVALNLSRGTGWRGLAALDSDIVRPLLHLPKSQLHDYALRQNLEWREDSTNRSMKYLRNQIRRTIPKLSRYEKDQLLTLRRQQLRHKKQIDKEVARLVGPGPNYSRYFFTHIPKLAAIECLRYVTKAKLTRPQLERTLLAIKTTTPGKTYQAGKGVTLSFTSRNFSV